MFLKKILHFSLPAFLMLVICALVVFVVYQHYDQVKDCNCPIHTFAGKHQEEDKASLKEFIEKERVLKSIQQTVSVAYGISEWESRYYAYVFYDFSKHYNIPWEVYPAMIRVESNFRTTLRSPKDAKGLSQVLEGTAIPIAKKIGIQYISGETLWNDLLNLVIGMTYFSEQINSIEGSKDEKIKHGIKCYLGGPDYLRKSASNESTNTYLANYSTTIWQEYLKLKHIYKGIYAESDSKICFPVSIVAEKK
jgi:hypothetical protein